MSSPASPQPSQPRASPPRRQPLARSRWPWIGLACIGCSIGGALLWAKLRPDPSDPSAVAQQPDVASPIDDLPGDGTTPDRMSIDRMIREGRFEAALRLCGAGAEGSAGAALDALDFRAALCLEALGDRDKAISRFRTVSGRNP